MVKARTGRRMAGGRIEPELRVSRFCLRLSIHKVEELWISELVVKIDKAGILHHHRSGNSREGKLGD